MAKFDRLFDLSQLIKDPTRVTESSSTITDHVYTSKPENIVENFVSNNSLSDHFPVCFSRKINNKISKCDHITTSYRCFKNFHEDTFISDLTSDLNDFSASKSDINEDISIWYSIILKHLDCHAPYKFKRVKTKYLPDWYNQIKSNQIKFISSNLGHRPIIEYHKQSLYE